MEITKLLGDLNFIQQLGDNPNADNGMTAADLKEWFDKAPNAIKTYINDILIAELVKKFDLLDETDRETAQSIVDLTDATNEALTSLSESTSRAISELDTQTTQAIEQIDTKTTQNIEAFKQKTTEDIQDINDRVSTFEVGTGFLPTAGGKMTGNINMDGKSVKNLPEPVDDGDAVPKYWATTMVATTAVLSADGWVDNLQTATVDGVIEDSEKTAVITTAATESLEVYMDCDIRCIGQGERALTFSCGDVPGDDVVVNVLILTKGG